MDPLEHVAPVVLRPLPANAAADAALHAHLDLLGQKLPETLGPMTEALERVKASCEYDAAVNRAAAHVWLALERFYSSDDARVRVALLRFVRDHLGEEAQARVC